MLGSKQQKRQLLPLKRGRSVIIFATITLAKSFNQKISFSQGGMAGMCYFVPYCSKTRESSRSVMVIMMMRAGMIKNKSITS